MMANKRWTTKKDGLCDRLFDNKTQQPCNDIEQLAADLNELEAYRELGTVEELAAMKEALRWRPIGEEMPWNSQECLLADSIEVYAPIYQYRRGEGFCISCGDSSLEPNGAEATHWRPAPTDVPKEEG